MLSLYGCLGAPCVPGALGGQKVGGVQVPGTGVKDNGERGAGERNQVLWGERAASALTTRPSLHPPSPPVGKCSTQSP